MRPRQMVSELLALLGDPAGTVITPELALRYLNDANLEVGALLRTIIPERLMFSSTAGGDGSATEFTIPADCVELWRLTVRATESATELDMVELPPSMFGAVDQNTFYDPAASKGQIFWTRYGNNQVSVRPTPGAPSILQFYYFRSPTPLRYDHGYGVLDTGSSLLTDATKSWPTDFWETYTSYVQFLSNKTSAVREVQWDTPIEVSSNIHNFVILASLPPGISDQDILEYEVYTPTSIPDQFHTLIVRKAQILATKDQAEVAKLTGEFDRHLSLIVGGPAQ